MGVFVAPVVIDGTVHQHAPIGDSGPCEAPVPGFTEGFVPCGMPLLVVCYPQSYSCADGAIDQRQLPIVFIVDLLAAKEEH